MFDWLSSMSVKVMLSACLLQITLRRYFDLTNPSAKLQPLAVSKVGQFSVNIITTASAATFDFFS